MRRVIMKQVFFLQKILLRYNLVFTFSLHLLERKRNLSFNKKVSTSDFLFDYFRISSLELIAYEIYQREVKGNCAEVGVYRGIFASKINEYFPDRKLYLFDTFSGFDEKEVLREKQKGNIKESADFKNTSIENVLSIMPHVKNCIIKKGVFPNTANDVDDVFAFVSLDADLYDPIYSGLQYFYPRLSKGGVIFVHDYYNEKRFKGVKEAVDKYCLENNLFFIPLSDSVGTVVFIKN